MHASELLCRRDSNGQHIQCKTSELMLINKVVVGQIWLALTIPSLNIISKLKEQAMPQASEPCRSTLKLGSTILYYEPSDGHERDGCKL